MRRPCYSASWWQGPPSQRQTLGAQQRGWSVWDGWCSQGGLTVDGMMAVATFLRINHRDLALSPYAPVASRIECRPVKGLPRGNGIHGVNMALTRLDIA